MSNKMIVSCVREIKQLNAQLRKLKKRNGPVADQIATRCKPSVSTPKCLRLLVRPEPVQCGSAGFAVWPKREKQLNSGSHI